MNIFISDIDDQWPFRPRPTEGESFASWFSRVAWSNGLGAAELYPIALPGARMHRIDLDRFACDELIQNLSARTGVPASDLWPRTFHAWEGTLFEHDDGINKLIWLTPAGTHQTSKSFGQQVCPRCLGEAEVPYLKQIWRLSFASACKAHRTLLIDRCPACTAPIQPLYTPTCVTSMTRCWNCNFDLRHAVTERITDLSAQNRLLTVLSNGWGELGAYGSVPALSYFRILWIVYRLLATGRFALPLREWVGGPEPPSGIPRIKEVERLNPRCRHALVSMAVNLLEDWPERFMSACRDVGISARVLLKDAERTPFPLWEPVCQYLSAPVGEASPQDIKAAKAYLKAHGTRPTYKALQDLLGMHFHAHRDMALPTRKHAPYGTHRYWKLDGVSTEVRAAARLAARKKGENVGAWVDRVLRESLEPFDVKSTINTTSGIAE